MDIATEKNRARLQAKQRRLAAHDPAGAYELIRHFPALEFQRACYGGYWPLPNELDIRPLLESLHDMGESLALPCTPRKGHPLTFRAWQPSDTLKAGPYNTREPFPEQPEAFPDIVLVPLLAFTDQGERLGYGGGFYDRTLERIRNHKKVFACGVAYDGQKAMHLPTDAHDARLDAILTPSGFRKFT